MTSVHPDRLKSPRLTIVKAARCGRLDTGIPFPSPVSVRLCARPRVCTMVQKFHPGPKALGRCCSRQRPTLFPGLGEPPLPFLAESKTSASPAISSPAALDRFWRRLGQAPNQSARNGRRRRGWACRMGFVYGSFSVRFGFVLHAPLFVFNEIVASFVLFFIYFNPRFAPLPGPFLPASRLTEAPLLARTICQPPNHKNRLSQRGGFVK